MPGIPDGMSEPAWANLVFDPHCHVSRQPSCRHETTADEAASSVLLWESTMWNGGGGLVSAGSAPRNSEYENLVVLVLRVGLTSPFSVL